MHPLTIITAALASLSTTATAAKCVHSSLPGQVVWDISADGVKDVAGKCKGFWDNLNAKKFVGACARVGDPYCGTKGGDKHHLHAVFTTMMWCNKGHVESAWWEATKNKYGSIQCGIL